MNIYIFHSKSARATRPRDQQDEQRTTECHVEGADASDDARNLAGVSARVGADHGLFLLPVPKPPLLEQTVPLQQASANEVSRVPRSRREERVPCNAEKGRRV